MSDDKAQQQIEWLRSERHSLACHVMRQQRQIAIIEEKYRRQAERIVELEVGRDALYDKCRNLERNWKLAEDENARQHEEHAALTAERDKERQHSAELNRKLNRIIGVARDAQRERDKARADLARVVAAAKAVNGKLSLGYAPAWIEWKALDKALAALEQEQPAEGEQV